MNFLKKKTTKSYFKFLKKINLKKDKYFLIKNFGSVAGINLYINILQYLI